MEREGPETTIRLLRAIRSLNYNRRLQPLVKERIEKAEGTIRNHLLLHDSTEVRVGPYAVCENEEGEIWIKQLAVDGWRQMPLTAAEEEQYLVDEAEDMARFSHAMAQELTGAD